MTPVAPDPVIAGLATLARRNARHHPAGGRRRWERFAAELLLGAAAGGVLWTAFPPVAFWPSAPIAVLVLTLAVRRSAAPRSYSDRLLRRIGRAAGVGFTAGLAFFVPLLSWLTTVTPLAWLVLAVAEAGYFAALGAALASIRRLPGWPVWAACLWVAEELIRDRWPLGGFTWGRLAFSQPDTPFTGLAALGGAPLVSFAVAVTGGLLAWAFVAFRHRATTSAIVAVLVAAAIPALATGSPRPTKGTPLQVAVIQGNVPHPGTHFLGRAQQVLTNHLRETAVLETGVQTGRWKAPNLVIWPENASDVDPLQTASARTAIQQAADELGVPLLVGAVVDAGPDHLRNEGIVWQPRTGPAASYAKRHLVPFGEYIPWRGLVSHLTSLVNLVPWNFLPGDGNGVLDTGAARLADVICFEIAFDDTVRSGVVGGGQLIVVQTNNATYMHTAEPAQQLAMSQLRAVEHGRAVVVASTSGISAVISPDGRVVARTAQLTPAVLDETVPLRSTLTVADRLGAAPEWVLGILGLLAVLIGLVTERLRQRE